MILINEERVNKMTSFHNSFLLVKRPKAIYNQVKASLLKTVLGSKWYEKDQSAVILLDSQDKLDRIKSDPEKKEIIRKNVLYWISKRKDQIQFYTLFQLCLEFEFVDEWNLLWEQKNKLKWSMEEEALFLAY
jgi:hypothetical protein